MKKLILNICLVSLSFGSFGQQLPVVNQYMFNRFVYNPAQAGVDDLIHLNLISHSHLNGFESKPVSNILTIDGQLVEDKMGLGLKMISDKSGLSEYTGITGAYSYHLKLSDKQDLRFGLGLGLAQQKINLLDVTVKHDDDPVLGTSNLNRSTLDAEFGVSYKWKELGFDMGISHIPALPVSFEGGNTSISYRFKRHYSFALNYSFYPSSNKDVILQPNIMVRTMHNAPSVQEASMLVSVLNQAFVGFSYRNNYGFGAIANVKVKDRLQIGASFDLITSELSNFAYSSHEIMVGYNFGHQKRSIEWQKQQIDMLAEELEQHKLDQLERDKIQDARIDSVVSNQDKQSEQLTKLDDKINQTRSELDNLKKELERSGLLKTGFKGDFKKLDGSDALPGNYLVIASVKDKNYNEAAMKSEYLDKGYQVVYNSKRGWYYVYSEMFEDFSKALNVLKEARAGEHKKAWIHVLR